MAAKPQKVAYFQEVYSRMHRGIVAHDYYIDESNVGELREMDFVFLCIDRGGTKRTLVEKLESFGISFIDVGMGLYVQNETLHGILRVTTSTSQARGHVHEKGRIPFADGDGDGDDEYASNIQVADLNALNAMLAIVKWKKLCGFYGDFEQEHFSAFTLNGNSLVNEDNACGE